MRNKLPFTNITKRKGTWYVKIYSTVNNLFDSLKCDFKNTVCNNQIYLKRFMIKKLKGLKDSAKIQDV